MLFQLKLLLSFDDGARLEIMNKPQMTDGEKSRNRTGYIHLAFGTGGKEGVDTLTERLRADGFHVIDGPRTTGDGYYEACVEGFEGNLIEITI
ncbi:MULTISPECIES: VOC family protein [Prevotella]|uniref:VOC family protein n=1 Tax=Prevotella TaxID=838 RepID=UPI001E43C795|nr:MULTISPECIES: VOC family protein [Prevotella]